MALMYNSNWVDSLQQLNAPVNIFQEEMELLQASQSLCFTENYLLPETSTDPLYGLNNNLFFSDDNYGSFTLPYMLNPCDQHEYFLAPDHFPGEDILEQFHSHKPQKIYEYDYLAEPKITFPNPSLFQDFTVSKVAVPACDLPSSPPVYGAGNSCSACEKKPQEAERTLSAQSIAARQRRRKITQKTHELGKLVPGGLKMNTAEMFEAAFKYIKYLQAQVALLESMASFEDNGLEHHSQDLQALIASPFVQEKLYSSEKCLVSENFMEALANDSEIQSNPTVLKEVRQVIRTCG